MEPAKPPRLPRAAKENSTARGAYNTASIPPKPKPDSSASAVAGTSGTVISPSKTDKSPKKSAKGKGKSVDSDIGPEDDGEGRVAASRRLEQRRQNGIQVTPMAADSIDDSATEPETTTKPSNTPPVTSTPPTWRRGGPLGMRAIEFPTIQGGSIFKLPEVKKQPQKPKRKRRKADCGYESVPDESDEEAGNSNTIAKLRETIDRHARWCPFVHLNKKLHNVYRRTKHVERSDFEDSDETSESDEDDDDDTDSEGAQSDAESDDGEDAQPSKTKQSKQTAKKTVPKNAALKKTATGKAAPGKAPTHKARSSKKVNLEDFDLFEVQDGTSSGVGANEQSRVDASEKNKSGNEHGVDRASEVHVSDEELSSWSDDEVEQLQESHEREQMVLHKQAADASPVQDTSAQKRKLADLGSGLDEEESRIKKRHSA